MPQQTLRYDFGTILRFGKHSGQSINEIIKEDPQYILWMADNFVGVDWDPEIVGCALSETYFPPCS